MTKLQIKKVKTRNPQSKELGFSARVITNGTADFDNLCEEAGKNTTIHKAEVRAASQLFVEAAASALKNGMIVDLGPLGKLYPTCSSGWKEKEEDLSKSDVKLSVNYAPSADINGAILSATTSWTKATDEEAEADNTTTGNTSGGSTQTGGIERD